MNLLIALCFATHLFSQDSTLPVLNQRIVDHVRVQEGTQVGRGECWDLAADALNATGAKWDGQYGFGRMYNPKKEPMIPGDILRFQGVTMERNVGTGVERFSFMEHTAVIIEVKVPDEIVIMHQNFGPSGRKASRLLIRPSEVVKGRLLFHRPQH